MANYFGLAQNTLARMRLISGVGYYDTCFDHPNWSNNDYDQYPTRCSAVSENQFFEYAPWQDIPDNILDPSFSGETHYGYYEFSNTNVNGLGTDCSATNCSELVMFARWVTDDVCTAYNNQVGISNPSGNPPVYSYGQYISLEPFNCTATGGGSYCYNGGSLTAIGGGYSPDLAGEATGCFSARHYNGGGPIGNMIYTVLEVQ